MSVSFLPALDPLGHTARLTYQAQFPLLGLPLAVRSNSSAVIAAARNSFGYWCDLPEQLIEPARPLDVALVVHAANPSSGYAAPFIYRLHSDCFLAASEGNLLTAQRDRGWALGFVTPELVAEPALFRYGVLDCLALSLASWRDRTPIHAAAVVRNGRAVLLLGPSQSGKSTLSYACQREGFHFLAEDALYVSTKGGLRLWSNSRQISLEPEARALFPELAATMAKTMPNGKFKVTVDLAGSGALAPNPHIGATVLCWLQHRPDQASALEPLALEILVETIREQAESGFDLDPRMPHVLADMARGGAYLLTHGRDLAGAVALLQRLTD
jgi:hypothetical protein